MVRAAIVFFAILFLSSAANAEKRVALVIGNSAYKHTAPLENPKNDAVDVIAALKSHKFQIVEGFDLDKAAFDRKVRDFATALQGADVGLFFFAGHGLQVAGQNHLVPIDAELTTAVGLEFEMVRLDTIHRVMERQTSTNILFLDACRDNPFARNLARAMGTRSTEVGKGLAAVESGIGTLISFSTQPGNVALDGAGRNSPFASALVRHVLVANDDLGAILIAVRNDVMKETKRKQVPWEHSALTGRFYFRSAALAGAGSEQVPSAPPDPAKFYRLLMDWALSQKVRRSPNRADIGKINPYRTEGGPRAMAICVNWEASTPTKPSAITWAYATRHSQGGLKTQKEVDALAIERCKSFAAFECECVIVDRNDKNAFSFPAAWLKEHK